jgi:hypothetical protein
MSIITGNNTLLPHPGLGKTLLACALIVSVLISGGCSNTGKNKGPSSTTLGFNDFGKSTIDQITEMHVLELRDLTRSLMIKLYKRNPRELRKQPKASIESRLTQLYKGGQTYTFQELNNRTGTEAVQLAFSKNFRGDRVFALIVGMKSMLHASYSYRTEFYYFDSVDQQELYDSARNLEIINWRLITCMDDDHQPLIFSNSYLKTNPNLSYERLFSKMIATQDMMAKIVADRTKRTIISVAQSAASTLLIPIGI